MVTDPSTASPVFEVELGPRERVERIGPYEVIGILGRGGMGIVYEVRCPDRAGHFALKTIEAQCLRADSELAQQRFSREIDVLQRVEHPSVIRMLDHGWAEHPLGYRLAYFLMEKLEGVSLKAKLQTEGPLSVADAAEIAVQLLQGLTYLEGLDLVHRDIKPANVFITDHRRVVLMDFGLARNVEDTRLTQVGRVIGTLAYMSPEALKAADVDGRADVYAVGVLLFEMLTGRPPYQGSNANAYLSASKTGMSDEDRKLLPPVVIQLLDRMLRADLRGRPYASELTAEIEAVSQSESWSQPHAGQSHAGQSHAGQSHAGQSHAGQSHAGQSHAGKSVVLKVPTRAIGWPHSSLTTWLAISVAFGVGVVVGRGSTPTEPAAAEVVRSVELESAPIPRFESAGAAFIFGLAALDRGRYQTAVEALEQAVDHNPALAMAHRRLGDALLAQRRFEAAATSYKMFLTLKPNTPDADVLRVLLNDLSQSSTAPEAR